MKRIVLLLVFVAAAMLVLPRPRPAYANAYWSGPNSWSGCWQLMWQQFWDPNDLGSFKTPDPPGGRLRSGASRAAPRPTTPAPTPRTPVSGPSDTN